MSNETIADIAAEIRDIPGDMYDGTISMFEGEFHSYADRIEAAAKRKECELLAQMAELRQKIDDGKFFTPKAARDAIAGERPLDEMLKAPLPIGNAAAMREALLNCARYIQCLIGVGMAGEVTLNDNINLNADNLVKAAIAAISAPPKNCDVGTAEEQAERFSRFCQADVLDVCSKSCPLYNHSRSRDDCAIQWEQMPYKEGGED